MSKINNKHKCKIVFLALKSSPNRRRPTFKEPKRSIINEESNEPVLSENTEYEIKSFKDFKPIDSVDSVSGILNPVLNLPTQPKFSNLHENYEEEQAKSSPTQRNQHLSTSSISIKIEPHSPIKIKTTNDLIDPNQMSPNQYNSMQSPQNTYKFNGIYFNLTIFLLALNKIPFSLDV